MCVFRGFEGGRGLVCEEGWFAGRVVGWFCGFVDFVFYRYDYTNEIKNR